ncbi:hypothetical protein B0H13DRAFT_1886113 [Mycena leptocephala]|nr:hypothetical protein B0H13DRAFT_1886113 [Mycena leptocephala]
MVVSDRHLLGCCTPLENGSNPSLDQQYPAMVKGVSLDSLAARPRQISHGMDEMELVHTAYLRSPTISPEGSFMENPDSIAVGESIKEAQELSGKMENISKKKLEVVPPQ